MSVESWKLEFYPKDAETTEKEESAKHSLRKWIGLRPENLSRHDVFYSGTAVIDRSTIGTSFGRIPIDSSSCALCHNYFSYESDESEACTACPLAQIRDGYACDFGDGSPWSRFTRHRDPEPMINLLERVVAQEKK